MENLCVKNDSMCDMRIMTFDKCRWMHLFLRQQVFRRRVIRLLVTRKLHLGSWDVHFVASQDAVGVLLGPQVVVLWGGFFGSALLDPTHFYGMDQLPDLTERDGCSDGTVERKTHSNISLSWLRAHVYDHYSKHSLHTSPVYCIKHIVYSDRNQPEYLIFLLKRLQNWFLSAFWFRSPLCRHFRPLSTLKTMWESLFVTQHSWEQLGDETWLFSCRFLIHSKYTLSP